MPQNCPHCGTVLPAVVDAFCPECREDLSETPESLAYVPPPAPPVVPVYPVVSGVAPLEKQRARLAPMLGLLLLIYAAFQAIMGNYVDAVIECCLAGFIMLTQARDLTRLFTPEKPERTDPRKPRK